MCLMEMTFVRPANDRAITFDEIAQKTNLNKSGNFSLYARRNKMVAENNLVLSRFWDELLDEISACV